MVNVYIVCVLYVADCKFNCHKKCASQVPKNCLGEMKWSTSKYVFGFWAIVWRYFPSVLWRCWLGIRKGRLPVISCSRNPSMCFIKTSRRQCLALLYCCLISICAWIKNNNRSLSFPFSALTLLVGRQEWHPACKNDWMLVCWWWFDWSFARLIAPGVQLSPPPPSSFASTNTG